MRTADIELGGIYKGRTGEERKVVVKNGNGWELKYEVVTGKRLGHTNVMFVDLFARWAVSRVDGGKNGMD